MISRKVPEASPFQLIRIRHEDAKWHEPFFAAVEAVFGCGDIFRRWARSGGWNAEYQVLALAEGQQLVSTIGVMNMHFLFDGVEHEGIQLGAVGTLSGYRQRGLARRLMDAVLTEHSAPTRPAILFANESVVDFYPKFGFRPVIQHRFLVRGRIEPNGRPHRHLDMTETADRRWLAERSARTVPVNFRFGVRSHFAIGLWHLIQGRHRIVCIDDLDAVLVVSQTGERLFVHDVCADLRFDLPSVLGTVIQTPVEEVEFGFDPRGWAPAGTVISAVDAEEPCFLLWSGDVLTSGGCRFPDLART